MKNSPNSTASRTENLTPLLLKAGDVCRLLGGIHPRSLTRMEARGLLRPVPLLRHKLYSREDVLTLIHNLKNWEAKA